MGTALIGDAAQGNVSSSEQSAAVAHELSQQTMNLRATVD